MPGFTSYEQVGKKEDVSDYITNVSPKATPFVSSIRKGKADNTIIQWQEDALSAPNKDNAQVEGFDATAANVAPTTNRSNYTQILSTAFQITGTADAVKTYGRDKESAYQTIKKGKELKRDLEAVLLSGQAAALGSSSVGRKTASIQAQIASAVSTATSPAGPLTQANVLTTMEKVYVEGGEPSVLLARVGDAKVINTWAVASGSSRVMNDKNTTLTAAVDVYRTPYGVVSVKLARYIRQTDCLIYDPEMITARWLRPWQTEVLAKTGDSYKVMLLGEVALQNDSQLAHGLITGLN